MGNEIEMNGGYFKEVTNEDYKTDQSADVNTCINSDLVDTRGVEDVPAH